MANLHRLLLHLIFCFACGKELKHKYNRFFSGGTRLVPLVSAKNIEVIQLSVDLFLTCPLPVSPLPSSTTTEPPTQLAKEN